jgi:hypothetical protein
MPSPLEKAIYRTLAYFAYFHYPLSAFEIWKWLLAPERPVAFMEVVQELEDSVWLKERYQAASGFYALGDVQAWHGDRHVRFLDAVRKMHKVQKVVRLLGRLPWIDGVAVCNSLAWYHTTTDSDIDVFIVTRPGRIWSARLLATTPAMLLRQRPGEATADPVCFSFFSTDQALQFEKLKIAAEDPYLAYWCRSLIPVVDHSGWMDRFEMSNPWLRQVLPHAQFVRPAYRFRGRSRWRLPWLPISEKLFKQVQLDKFPQSIRQLMNLDTRVVVTDDQLKFHDTDRRAEINSWMAAAEAKV